MSEHMQGLYEPVPLGPGKPGAETPGLDPLLPPLPKPAEPVAPRSAVARLTELANSGNSRKPAAEQVKEPTPTKPPVPGRMAWLPEVLRAMVRPTRQKGIIVAGIVSLGLASLAAHQFWPTVGSPVNTGQAAPAPAPAPVPLLGAPPARDPAVAPPPILEVSAMEPVGSQLPPPRIEVGPAAPDLPPAPLPKMDLPPPRAETGVPKVQTLPAVDLPAVEIPKTTPSPPKVDEQVQPTSGLQLPEAPVIPAPIPASAASANADPAPPAVPNLPPPLSAPPAGAPGATAPGSGSAPGLQMPEMANAPPPALVLPLPAAEPSRTSPPPPSAMPNLPSPKIENLPPATNTPPQVPKMDSLPPLTNAPSPLPNMDSLPPVTNSPPPAVGKPEPPTTVLPELAKPVSPPAPQPAAEVGIKQAAVLAPREDYDVDVHYPSSGETWQSISREQLGDARYAEALRAYNGGRPLIPNQPVDIPPIRILRKQFGGLIPTPAPAEPEPVPPRPAGAWRTYEVPQGGMTLKELARRAFGDENLWGPIWEMNPKLRADEPVPGGTLVRLPADARIGN